MDTPREESKIIIYQPWDPFAWFWPSAAQVDYWDEDAPERPMADKQSNIRNLPDSEVDWKAIFRNTVLLIPLLAVGEFLRWFPNRGSSGMNWLFFVMCLVMPLLIGQSVQQARKRSRRFFPYGRFDMLHGLPITAEEMYWSMMLGTLWTRTNPMNHRTVALRILLVLSIILLLAAVASLLFPMGGFASSLLSTPIRGFSLPMVFIAVTVFPPLAGLKAGRWLQYALPVFIMFAYAVAVVQPKDGSLALHPGLSAMLSLVCCWSAGILIERIPIWILRREFFPRGARFDSD